MNTFFEIIKSMWNSFSLMTMWDVLDILIVAFFLYKLISFLKNTRTMQVLRGIILLLVILGISGFFQLHTINFILSNAMQLGFLAVIIVFQPELRKMLERVGSKSLPIVAGKYNSGRGMDSVILQTVEACSALSWAREGALIVFERGIQLDNIIETGTLINSDVSSELLKNIFYPKAPLHDGAVVIRENRIAGAGCMLPLTSNTNLSRDLGMRHRAGVGMSENSDALTVIVSEETGSISVAQEGMLKRHLSAETLEMILKLELMPSDEIKKKDGLFGFIKRFKGKKK